MFVFLKLYFKALHFPDLFVKHYTVQAGAGKRSVLCSYLSIITRIMNGELSPSKKKGNNTGHDYNVCHFLIWVLRCSVSCLLNVFLKGVFIIKENYEKLLSAMYVTGMCCCLNYFS